MIRHVEPSRRYLWSKGRLSEPSWLGSWVDPNIWKENFIFIFLRFFFFSSSPATFLYLSRSLPPHDTRHPPHPIARTSSPYPPLPFTPHPCLLLSCPTPSKPCPFTLDGYPGGYCTVSVFNNLRVDTGITRACGNYTVQLAWYRYVLFYLCTVVHSMHC
jgi:hypothetical protein